MQHRRDQVQAQAYMVGRLVNALVMSEPDAREHPYRRAILGTLAGVVVAVLVMGGFAVFGFIVPGGAQRWRDPGSIVVEKETGTRYIYDGTRLRPVLNLASARLLFDKPPKVVQVSGKSLARVPRGQPVGIPGAPDTLPRRVAVDRQAWTVCALAGRDSGGTLVTATTLSISESGDATALADLSLGPDEATVVGSGQDSYLIWRGHRLRLTRAWLARLLGYDAAPYAVEPGWLETVPVGPDLAPVPIPDRGADGPFVDGRRAKVGELFIAHTSGLPDRHYLLRTDGRSQLTDMAHAIVAADPDTAKAYAGRPVVAAELSPAALAALPVSGQPVLPAGTPEEMPRMSQQPRGGGWCAQHSMADGAVTVTDRAPPTDPVHDGLALIRTAQTADGVSVPPGIGGLVYPGRVGQPPGVSFYLVVDSGVKYPLGSAEAAKRLGYAAASAHPVPRRLLDMLPTGPLLEVPPIGG